MYLQNGWHNLTIWARFIASENTTVDQAYFDALAADKDLGQTRGIDATLKKFKLDALILPSSGSPGPQDTTYFLTQYLSVTSYNP